MPAAARVFRALADPTRREILQVLKQGERAAGDIAAYFVIAQPSVSRHLSILSGAGLVLQRRAGNRVLYRLQADTLATTLNDFVSAVCPTQVLRRRGKSRRATRGEP